MDSQLQQMQQSPEFSGQLSRVELEPHDAACLHEQDQIQQQYCSESPSSDNSREATPGMCHIKEEPLADSSNEYPIVEVKTEPYHTAILAEQDQMRHRHDPTSEGTSHRPIMASFVRTQKGGIALHCEGYKYIKQRRNTTYTTWRCCRYKEGGCQATAHTRDTPDSITVSGEHNHFPDKAPVMEDTLRERLRQRARNQPHIPAPELYTQEIVALDQQGVDADVLEALPSFDTMKGIMYRQRRLNHRSAPRTAAGIVLTEHYERTVHGKRFVLYKEMLNGEVAMCFATQKHIKLLSRAQEVFVECTSFACPALFTQVVTFSIQVSSAHVIVAYFFLKGRSYQTYQTAFALFVEMAQQMGYEFSSLVYVRSDFEQALIQALEAVFHPAQHRGCHFHFGQCIWRQVQHLGLTQLYREDRHFCSFIRNCVSLAFLPAEPDEGEVRTAWQMLKEKVPQVDSVQQFLVYFEQTWMGGTYPIRSWNQYGNRGPRTNNFLDSCHRKIKKVLGKAHTNIYTCLEALKREEARQTTSLRQVLAGSQRRQRLRKWQLKDRAIADLERQYAENEIPMTLFLKEAQKFCGI
ncbi:uncharacterized protein LOC135396466 isoform X1 [Ornithodoros turicata]|uniref:uncharacterized protein LOC135396466 isoform X1 n=1 Tax=Ornithodoros turicata TaxID=34597 RepID=UPI003139A314